MSDNIGYTSFNMTLFYMTTGQNKAYSIYPYKAVTMDRFTPSKILKTIQGCCKCPLLTILPVQLLRFLQGLATCVLTSFILCELLKIFVFFYLSSHHIKAYCLLCSIQSIMMANLFSYSLSRCFILPHNPSKSPTQPNIVTDVDMIKTCISSFLINILGMPKISMETLF